MPGLVRAMIAAAVCACAHAAPALPAPAPGCTDAGIRRSIADARFAQGRYRLEATGAAVRAALARVAADRVLAQALSRGDRGAARARALALVSAAGHVTAIRVVAGRQVLVETNRYPFDVAGAATTLRDARGVTLGTLEVTIQDVIGFIRLVHEFTGGDVVVRGSGGEARGSLAAALAQPLPREGCIRLGPRSYAVRSFAARSFTGEALRIWVLRRA